MKKKRITTQNRQKVER